MAASFDEIRAIVSARNISKAEKIDFLKKNGFNDAQAEETYRAISFAMKSFEANLAGRRFTIGVEIEAVNVNRDAVRAALAARGVATHDDYHNYNHNDSQTSYKFMRDGSLNSSPSDSFEPCEIVSPILRDLKSLKVVCEALNEAGAKVNKSCGLHVHFGAAGLTAEQMRRVFINYANIENVIDSFMPESRRNSRWCKSLRDKAQQIQPYYNICDMRHVFDDRYGSHDRYYKVNLEAFFRHKTIEFRQHSGTINYGKIENWVKFLSQFLNWTLKHEEPMAASSIDELLFLTAAQKRFYKARKAEIENNENR